MRAPRVLLLLAFLTASATAARGQDTDPTEAAQRGIDWLLPAVCDWIAPGDGSVSNNCAEGGEADQCFGCHVAAESLFGLARTSDRCYRLPRTPCVEAGDADLLEFGARFVGRVQRKECILGPRSCPNGGGDPTTRDGYPPNLGSIGVLPECGSNSLPTLVPAPKVQSAHGGLALAGYSRYLGPGHDANLEALADWLVQVQDPDGRWRADRFEPPVDQGDSFVTGAALTILRAAATALPARAGDFEPALVEGAAWTAGAFHKTTQDWVFSLLGLREAGAPPLDPVLEPAIDALRSRQQVDGGWAERDGLESNAYATGQAVHALHEAGVSLEDPALCAGIDWLTRRQGSDGSWAMGFTGVSTDSSRPSRFTATIWPVLALGSLERFGVDVRPRQVQEATCLGQASWVLEVHNTGDNPCGAFQRPDILRLEVDADAADRVEVDPEQVAVNAGGWEPARVTWTRTGPPLEVDQSTSFTVRVVSEGADEAGCPRESQALFTVTGIPDRVPGPLQRQTLRLRRDRDDLLFTWLDPPDPVGGFQLQRHPCPVRAACDPPPRKSLLDDSDPVAEEGPSSRETRLAGEAQREGELLFYKVRGRSPCFLTPGPTCSFDCTDPDLCNALCE